jgi:hypothetical protein
MYINGKMRPTEAIPVMGGGGIKENDGGGKFKYDIYIYIYLSVCLSIYLSICLSIYLSVYLSIYLSIYIVVLGLELGAYTLSHSTSPFL